MVMRPKSMATVVVRLSGTAARSSTPSDTSVIACSVFSGGISDSVPTMVVLPTPNPPATRIFSGVGTEIPASGPASTGAESIEQPSQDLLTRSAVGRHRRRGVHRQVAGLGQVADQHPCHADRQAQGVSDLDQRDEPFAQLDD